MPSNPVRMPASTQNHSRAAADGNRREREALPAGSRHDAGMTTPQPSAPVERGLPQPRDIALEMETPEQAAELEAQSEPEDAAAPEPPTSGQ